MHNIRQSPFSHEEKYLEAIQTDDTVKASITITSCSAILH